MKAKPFNIDFVDFQSSIISPKFALFIIGMFVVFVVSSCADREEPHVDRVPVTFTSLIEGGVEAGASQLANRATTRVSGTSWAAGDQIGIFMYKAGTTTPLSSNIPYKAATAGEKVSLIPASSPIYYPVDGSKVNFVAYYPYDASCTTGYSLNLASQETTLATDLLYYRDVEDTYNQYDASATLTFKHAMSKIIINITRGPGVSSDITGLVAKINKIPYYGVMNFSYCTFSSLASGGIITTKKTSSAADRSVHEAILFPHKAANYANRSITFTIGTTTYNFPITTAQDFDRGYIYTYNFILTQTAIVLQEATIEDWNSKGTLTYGAPSNCYILKPGGHTIAIPVSRANEFMADQIGENTPFTASILWNDGNSQMISLTKSSGTGYKDYIHVTSNADKTMVGNALVTLKNTSGTILWSWHIWVTDYDPDAEGATWTPNAGSTNPRTTFMDRNLGATENTLSTASRGLHYQWGRKDPFPRMESITSKASAGDGVSIATTIKNPTVFYYAMVWHETNRTDLWVTANDKKTIFDPCPTGWRVPTSGTGKTSPWYGLSYYSGTATGLAWGTNANWPIAGYRDMYSYGGIQSEDSNGIYWSATAYDNQYDSYAMGFTNVSVYTPEAPEYRANGCSVRCVKDN